MKTERTDTAFSVDTPPPGGLKNNQDTFWGAFLSWEIWEPFRAIAFNPHPITKVDVSTILRLKNCKSGITDSLGVRNSMRTELDPALLGCVHRQQCLRTHTPWTASAPNSSAVGAGCLWYSCDRQSTGTQVGSEDSSLSGEAWAAVSRHSYLSRVNSGLILHMGSIAAESHSPHLSSLKSFFKKKKMGRNAFFKGRKTKKEIQEIKGTWVTKKLWHSQILLMAHPYAFGGQLTIHRWN